MTILEIDVLRSKCVEIPKFSIFVGSPKTFILECRSPKPFDSRKTCDLLSVAAIKELQTSDNKVEVPEHKL
jgi:hypothetical protein